jgi:hypothetical protein
VLLFNIVGSIFAEISSSQRENAMIEMIEVLLKIKEGIEVYRMIQEFVEDKARFSRL